MRGVLLPGLLALPEQQRRLAAALLGVVPAALLAGAVALLVVPGLPVDAVGRLPQLVPVVAELDPTAPPPASVRVERLGVDEPLVNLRTGRDGVLAVPEDADLPGWWSGGTAPGDRGPAVLVGHVDSFDGPGVFFRLRELVVGDRVEVTRVDGSVVAFEVYGLESVAKDGFPTERVYGQTDGAELRLITCGGTFDRKSRSYRGNVVVYARAL